MVDISDLGAIDTDVPFDNGTADDLIAAFDNAATAVDDQASSRASYVTTGSNDFKGHFSELFTSNAAVASADATELASRLREVATAARNLKEEARKEQERRKTAREWKQRQDDRNVFEEFGDWVTGGEDPPVGPPADEPTIATSAPQNGNRETPPPGSGGGSGGTSSARPSNLRQFASGSATLNEALQNKPGSLRTHLTNFASKCRWGTLSADGVPTGFDKWLTANGEDVRWANTIADAFKAAGGEGNVSTLSNSALASALQAKGIAATRQDLTIDPPQAYGHPPTTGYSDDPVNTATGNFVETELDLGFAGAAASLAFTRTYNAIDGAVGPFGPGWSSIVDQRLELADDGARLVLPDGRQVLFPRQGDGWDRAPGEALWLDRVEGESGAMLVVTGNNGTRWTFSTGGQWYASSRGAGTGIVAERDDAGKLVRLMHERGRWIEIGWADGRIGEVTASDGRRMAYAYDDAGQLVSATGPNGTRTYSWNEAGLLTAVTGADGVVEVENTYDERRRVASQLSPYGRRTRYAYLPGRTTAVSDLDGGRSNTWIADQRGRLVGVVDTEGRRQSMSYDGFGNLVSATERNGATTTHGYDERGRKVRTRTASGADLTFGYDDADRVTTVVTESGAVTEYDYAGDGRNPSTMNDAEGGRTELRWEGGLLRQITDPTGVRVNFGYDDHGDLLTVTNAAGNEARLERDAAGRVTVAISPSGARTSYHYDAAGLLLSRREPNGATWRYEYTPGGKPTAVIDPYGARTELEYGPHGQVTKTIDALGRAVTRTFDDLGQVSGVELPDGAGWRFVHDAMSRLRETIDPTGGSWRREYDANGDLVAVTDPTGVRREASTDPAGQSATLTEADGTFGLRADQLGRPIAAEKADGSAELISYDRCGRPVELVDGEGQLTLLRRDAAGRVTERVAPSGATTRYTHDRCGRLAAVTDPLGGRTELEYDADGRVVRRVSPTGEVSWAEYNAMGWLVAQFVPGRGLARFAHDLVGRVIRTTDSWYGRRRFRYDAAGQLIETVNGNGGVTRYDYDARGRAVTITDPLGGVTRREYDAMNRVIAETDPLGRTTTGEYDAAGRRISQTDPSGHRIEWTYDAAGRDANLLVDGRLISAITRDLRNRRVKIADHSDPDRPIEHELGWNRRQQLVLRRRGENRLEWTYDSDARRATMTGPDGRQTRYERDGGGRVIAVDHPLLGRATFSYDGSGRLVRAGAGDLIQTWRRTDGFVVEHTLTRPDGSERTAIERDEWGRIVAVEGGTGRRRFGYDEAAQLIEERVGDGAVSTWQYDRSGRLTAEAIGGTRRDYSYDTAGQLTSTVTGGVRVRYAYDRSGRRTRAEASDGRVRELGWSDTGWLSTITDRDGDETKTTRLGVDALGELSRVDDAETWWDTATGYAAGLIQAGETPVVHTPGGLTGIGQDWEAPGWRTARTAGADPWTAGTPAAGTDGFAIGAAGEMKIAGLEWLHARAYDPATRGFLSVDPQDPTPGAGWSANPYSYAGNDPLHALDPAGRQPVTDEELKAYAASNDGAAAAVGDWVGDNWEYLAGGAMVIAGGVLMATGVGGPAGMMLISAGADTIIQKATTGSVNWGQVAISGAFGAWGGAGAAAKLGARTLLQKTVVGGMISGTASGATGGAYSYLTGPGPHTVSGFMKTTALSAGVGGVTGGAAGGFGHGANALGQRLLPRTAVPTPPPTLADEARGLMGNPGDTVVLGRLDDTAVAADWEDHVVLQTDNWSPELNDEFINATIDYQRPVYLASPIEGNMIQTQGPYAGQPTIFQRELEMLNDAGYTMDGDYMYPPR
ncbi:DUF6531 domain-containing protein [Microlunatus sp. GCM10028923]|uniref:DUF6531 domain-containing protein n=1 Tax=Microlunatus sp. GCM10028923 TaxID=3273400 RepID=UPI00360A1DE2